MFKLKKIISFVVVMVVVLSGFNRVYANELVKDVVSRNNEEQTLYNKINSLSNEEFDKFIVNYIRENESNGKSFKEVQQLLNKVSVVVDKKTNPQYNMSADGISPMYISPSKVELTIYTAKRTGDSFHRIIAAGVFKETETKPGSLDLLSIEWDYKLAQYHSTSPSTYTTYMDGSNRTKGIVLFNVEDSKITTNKTFIAAVYVTRKTTSTNWVEIGSKFVHSYNTTKITWNVGGNVGYTTTGPTGGISFNVQGSNLPDYWQIYADNAFKF